ncbi:lectin [Streptomyces sp. NPDC002698]|uniref:RICIN domain-containing protein n=1 Tax=Streptomyces sp. NPDC002698 TaxID=3364660 RepID=UPI0036C859D7
MTGRKVSRAPFRRRTAVAPRPAARPGGRRRGEPPRAARDLTWRGQGAAIWSGRCLDFFKSAIADNTQAELWDCGGGQNQTFTATSRGELVVYGDKCLDAYDSGTANGTRAVLRDCNGGTNQKWTFTSGGTVTSNVSGLCLDASGNGTANGTPVVLWSCNGGSNQRWSRD